MYTEKKRGVNRVYICVCVCVFTYVYIYIYEYLCMYIYAYMCIYMCVYIYIYIYTHIYVYVWIYICMNIYMYICVCAYMCMYILGFWKGFGCFTRNMSISLNSFTFSEYILYDYLTCGVMVKALACGAVVSEFKLQSHHYVHFRTSTLGKGMNPLILPAMG